MKAAFIGAEVRTAELVTLAVHLRWPDVDPLVATTAAEGLEMVERKSSDVVIMHPDCTDMTLSSTIGELRGFTNVPLLVLGHQGDEMEVVTSLEVGADDYVRLSCDLTEIMVRIWALLRRVGLRAEPDTDGPISSGRLAISPSIHGRPASSADLYRVSVTASSGKKSRYGSGSPNFGACPLGRVHGQLSTGEKVCAETPQKIGRPRSRASLDRQRSWCWIPIHRPALGLSNRSATHGGIAHVCNAIDRVD